MLKASLVEKSSASMYTSDRLLRLSGVCTVWVIGRILTSKVTYNPGAYGSGTNWATRWPIPCDQRGACNLNSSPHPAIIYLLLSKLDSPWIHLTHPVSVANKATSLVTSSHSVGSFQNRFLCIQKLMAEVFSYKCWRAFIDQMTKKSRLNVLNVITPVWKITAAMLTGKRSNWHGGFCAVWDICEPAAPSPVSTVGSTIFCPLHSRNNHPFCFQLAPYRLSKYSSSTSSRH